MMFHHGVLLPLLMFPHLAFAEPAGFCEGREPIEHDDGRYHFSSESFVRSKSGAEFYGRCIKVLSPTTELRNYWECVLPRGIAREERPLKSGRTFIDRKSTNASATLYYGNADDDLVAGYYAHEDETCVHESGDEQNNSSFRDVIQEKISELGEIVLESFSSLSFLVSESEPESIANLEVTFTSRFDGKTFQYAFSHSLSFESEAYESTALSVVFPGSSLRTALKSWKDIDAIPLNSGDERVEFQHADSELADFVDHRLLVFDADNQLKTVISITYFLPAK